MCAICDFRIELGVEHPRTLAVAVATRAAIEDGLLAAPAGTRSGRRARLAAVTALKRLQAGLEAALPRDDLLALPDFFALAVESRTWGFFRATREGFDADHRPDPPRLSAPDAQDRDAVVVTSAIALDRMLAGALPFDEAVRRGLVLVDADAPRRQAIAAGWDSACRNATSRFACA